MYAESYEKHASLTLLANAFSQMSDGRSVVEKRESQVPPTSSSSDKPHDSVVALDSLIEKLCCKDH